MNSMNGARGLRGAGPGEYVPKGYRKAQIANYTPQQMQQHRSLFDYVGPDSYLQQLAGGDESLFETFERPAMRQFQEQLGNIASRFSGMGLGGRKSSGFQNATTSAAQQFSENLSVAREQLKRQAIQDLFSLSNQLLSQNPYQNYFVQKGQSQPSGVPGMIGAGVGAIGGGLFGGPAGALTGAQAGYNIGNAFSGSGMNAGNPFQGLGNINLPSSWGSIGNSNSGQSLAPMYDAQFRANPALMY